MDAVGLFKGVKLTIRKEREGDEVIEVPVAQIALEVPLEGLDRDDFEFMAAHIGQCISVVFDVTWKPKRQDEKQHSIAEVTGESLPPKPQPVAAGT